MGGAWRARGAWRAQGEACNGGGEKAQSHHVLLTVDYSI